MITLHGGYALEYVAMPCSLPQFLQLDALFPWGRKKTLLRTLTRANVFQLTLLWEHASSLIGVSWSGSTAQGEPGAPLLSLLATCLSRNVAKKGVTRSLIP